jgi:hypothetical protein
MRKLDSSSVSSAEKELKRMEKEHGLKVEQIARGIYETQGANIVFTDNSISITYIPQGIVTNDFMGTFNHPKSKEKVWDDIVKDVKEKNYEVLKASGFTNEHITYFDEIITQNPNSMALRTQVISNPDIKKAVGNYVSVAAKSGGLQSCDIYQDGVEFLQIGKLLGYENNIFSTIKPKEGQKSLQQLMFERANLSEGAKVLFGISNPYDLIEEKVTEGSKMKADDPGNAVLTEAISLVLTDPRSCMRMYLDDEEKIINAVVDTFSKQSGMKLPTLVSVQREGIKTYNVPKEHQNIGDIIIASTLTDTKLLNALYK